MLAGDVRREAIGRHLLPAKPAEGLAGRDVDALHQQQDTNYERFADNLLQTPGNSRV
jgi:hypothetical protein